MRWTRRKGSAAPLFKPGRAASDEVRFTERGSRRQRSTAILLCIADRAEYGSVETQMFGDVQSNPPIGLNT
jgi:hypothetical protein